MTTENNDFANDYSHAYLPIIPSEQLQQRVPAAFATHPYGDVSSRYVFISTSQLVSALIEAGFNPVSARQTQSRGDRGAYAKHMIRFQPRNTTIAIDEVVPEIVLINAHDATSPYQVRAGLYRGLCANGLIARIGDFGFINVPHRGNVIANVVDAALTIMRGFDNIGMIVNQMRNTHLTEHDRIAFAHAAARVRHGEDAVPYAPSRLLEARRDADRGDDVWRVYNVVQENSLKGGVRGVTAAGRASRSRSITAIREDVRINAELWQLAMSLLRA